MPAASSTSTVSHIGQQPVGQQPAAGSQSQRFAAEESVIERSTIEIGGREGPEPTRFGDWEKRGRCIDF